MCGVRLRLAICPVDFDEMGPLIDDDCESDQVRAREMYVTRQCEYAVAAKSPST